tara:strand:+ start:133 stop:321 length:189 start_codon:yes stop_codon:yes gene_type:complete
MSKKRISNYPFGKNTESPNYYLTQDIYGDNSGITGRKKKRKKNFVSNKKTYKENILQISNKK